MLPAGPSNGQRAKLRDVAAAAGVSVNQASRALSGYSDVAEQTRERVIALARQMRYFPSLRARSLVAGSRAVARCAVVTLGFAPSGPDLSAYDVALPGVFARAAAEGMDVRMLTFNETADPAEQLARLVGEDRADAVILLTYLPLTPTHVRPLIDAGLPFVVVNRHFDYSSDADGAAASAISCVTVDWATATRDMLERQVALGHRRLAALFRAGETSTILDLERGWREGVARCGLDPASAPVLRYSGTAHDPGDSTGADDLDRDVDGRNGYALGKQLLTRGLPESGRAPTTIVGFNDVTAHGVLRAARDGGVPVPERLSVIGFGDQIARYTSPPLCSYNPHWHRAGELATELVGALLRGEIQGPRRIVLPLTFSHRASCGPAPRD